MKLMYVDTHVFGNRLDLSDLLDGKQREKDMTDTRSHKAVSDYQGLITRALYYHLNVNRSK